MISGYSFRCSAFHKSPLSLCKKNFIEKKIDFDCIMKIIRACVFIKKGNPKVSLTFFSLMGAFDVYPIFHQTGLDTKSFYLCVRGASTNRDSSLTVTFHLFLDTSSAKR